jgi:hypothetical protein
MSETPPQQPRSLNLFQQATPQVQELVKVIMNKERQEQYKKNRTDIYKTLLSLIKDSTP